MLSQEIRKRFLSYFKENKHTIVPSSRAVPHDDPTLLFVNAGMNQFKDVFLGKCAREYTRAVSSQKCIRVGGKHNDLENVGHTSRHMTFFEMLGNFSFGDYFKKEAIEFAWKVTTDIFQYDPSRIWVSVFETDVEAYELWKSHIDEKKIIRLGEDENFWSMGNVGPCGPCSELLYDRGEAFGSASTPLQDNTGERYPEFWNLVFMEFNRDSQGNMDLLPKQCVDTGAGLERVISFMTGSKSVFQSDILITLIARVEELSGKKYNPSDARLAPAFHVIADHIRTLAFAIADGAQPSNTERGYVLRKILRRAVRYGRLLGLKKPFLADVFPRLIDTMGSDYLELKQSESQIKEILSVEEESFFRTLHRGGNILNAIIENANQSERKEITGAEAFKLKDTYGFPLEEILLIAKDSQLSVNLESYDILEKQARERSRRAKTAHQQIAESSIFEIFSQHHEASIFVGYDKEEGEGSVIGLIVQGELVEVIEEGQEGLVILDKTPFYPEKGGQIGDRGMLTHAKARFVVDDCQTPYAGIIVHSGVLEKGSLMIGEPVSCKIDRNRRYGTTKHHTATHLLHWALQQTLGSHIKQAGSLVEQKRLRFDFNHHKALSQEEIRTIETLVNEKIWENHPVTTYEIPFEDLQNHPEVKRFFGDKYGNIVRVVDINHFSKELCGGTHVENIGEIGYFRVAKEGSIAKGVRRIEGVIGKEGEKLRYALEDQLSNMALALKSTLPKVEESLQNLVKENNKLKEQALFARKKYLNDLASSLMKKIKKVKGYLLLSSVVDIEKKELNELGNDLMQRIQSGILLLCIVEGEECQLYLKVSSDLVREGIYANALIKKVADFIEGSGGGKKEMARAGGKNSKGVIIAFEKIEEMLRG